MTGPRDWRRRQERELLRAAAEKLRGEARREQAEAAVGRALIVPYERYVVVGLLDELSLAAGRGELPDGVRRLAVELAEKILKEGRA
ncbi:hypothetical protein AB0I53_18050 [Saccharopolyspora sp. NPDC050389]|uniref:hypothetical protein n=1 Tax=Saccharopolyspora sp. NPDC050389 TaxID=3155516 RepID=UPI0033D3588D